MHPPVRYAQSGAVQVAYQVTGDGPVDLVLAPGTASHLYLDWDWPPRARFYEEIGTLVRDRVRGIAVHLAARIGGVANADEELISSTVRDLTVGAGLLFEDRGSRELKGVPGAQHIFSVLEA
jgi:hypothetical protein